MNVAIKTIECGKFTIEIFQDEISFSLRGCDNLGTIYYVSQEYELGDERIDRRDIPDLDKRCEKGELLCLPAFVHMPNCLYHLDGNNLDWETGQTGIIAVSREKVLKNYKKKIISKKLRETVLKQLQAEIDLFNQYLSEGTYAFIVSHTKTCDKCKHTERIVDESVCGYYDFEQCKAEAKETCEQLIQQDKS